MPRHLYAVSGLAAMLALTLACNSQPAAPTSPTTSAAGSANIAPDGSTLKVLAPTLLSPINNVRISGDSPATLVVEAGLPKFGVAASLSHRFELYNNVGALVQSAVVDSLSYVIQGSLAFGEAYSWRSRAELDGAFGPWSDPATFLAPEGGYIRGNELYDPLYNGRTLAETSHGAVFVPNVGIQLLDRASFVQWRLPERLPEGEFSVMLTNLGNGSEDWKTKVMSMIRDDGSDTTLNPYRVTIDKRTDWLGQGARVRYTMRSRGREPAAEPAGGFQRWSRSQVYLWTFTWRGGLSRLVVREGGPDGPIKENIAHDYPAPYDPFPHLIRLGSVGGRAADETNPGTIAFNVWVSPNARPATLPNE